MHFLCAESSAEERVVSVPAGSRWLLLPLAQSNLINFSSHQDLLCTHIFPLTWTIPAVLILMRNITRRDKLFPPKAGGEQIHPLKSLWGCTRRLFLLCGPPHPQQSMESVKLIQLLCCLSLTEINWELVHQIFEVTALKLRGELFLGSHAGALSGRSCWPVLSCQTECKRAWWQEGFCCLPEAEAAREGTFQCTPSSPPPPCAEKDEEGEDSYKDKEQEKRKREEMRGREREREGGPLHTAFLKCHWVGFNWIVRK